MKYIFVHNKKEYTLALKKTGDDFIVSINDIECTVTEIEQNEVLVIFTLNDVRYAVYARKHGVHYYLSVAGEDYIIEERTGSGFAIGTLGDQQEDAVSSPMPGLVVKIPVEVGDAVDEGTTLAIIEAMKMQNELRASRKGIVKAIHFREGDQVDAFQSIVELE
jgi:biotin carboxyl carrier protein